MIGPSSSHTAGAVRLGALARAIFGSEPTCAEIQLHGSFAATGDGHGTKLALVAGLLGMKPDDVRISESFTLAAEKDIPISFELVELDEAHPNTAVFKLWGEPGEEPVIIQGSSIGGGNVVVTNIGDFVVHATGEMSLLVVEHTDQPGVIHAVSGMLTDSRINIAAMDVSREMRGARALMLIETDGCPDATTLKRMLKQNCVHSVRFVPAV